MHVVRFHAPTPALRRYIRNYSNRYASLRDSTIVHPIPARATHVIEFTFGDRYLVLDRSRSIEKPAHPIVVVGTQTHRRVELTICGTVDGFAIFFEATSLRELFGIPVLELTDRDEDAHAVIGREMTELREVLGNCGSFEERVRAANAYFLHRCRNISDADPVVLAVRALQRAPGCSRVDSIAQSTGLSIRQFQRRFAEYVGLSPKLFARIVRFESALEQKAISPKAPWTEIAQEFGYHDQMHMIHDFRLLAGDAPGGIFAQLEKVVPVGSEAVARTA